MVLLLSYLILIGNGSKLIIVRSWPNL